MKTITINSNTTVFILERPTANLDILRASQDFIAHERHNIHVFCFNLAYAAWAFMPISVLNMHCLSIGSLTFHVPGYGKMLKQNVAISSEAVDLFKRNLLTEPIDTSVVMEEENSIVRFTDGSTDYTFMLTDCSIKFDKVKHGLGSIYTWKYDANFNRETEMNNKIEFPEIMIKGKISDKAVELRHYHEGLFILCDSSLKNYGLDPKLNTITIGYKLNGILNIIPIKGMKCASIKDINDDSLVVPCDLSISATGSIITLIAE